MGPPFCSYQKGIGHHKVCIRYIKHELVKHPPPVTLALLSHGANSLYNFDEIISCEKFNDIHCLLNATVYALPSQGTHSKQNLNGD